MTVGSNVKFGYALIMIVIGLVSQDAKASCLAQDKQIPAQEVSDFLANPGAILDKPENANGGGVLIVKIRDIVASNPATLPAVVALLKNANTGQQTAIGTGLGQAANLCNVPDPTFATDIGTQLAQSNSQLAQTNFALVTGKQTGGIGGGGGGFSNGGVGNGTGPGFAAAGGGTTSFQPFSSSGVQTSGTNYFTSSVAGASGVSGSTSTTIISNSVSR